MKHYISNSIPVIFHWKVFIDSLRLLFWNETMACLFLSIKTQKKTMWPHISHIFLTSIETRRIIAGNELQRYLLCTAVATKKFEKKFHIIKILIIKTFADVQLIFSASRSSNRAIQQWRKYQNLLWIMIYDFISVWIAWSVAWFSKCWNWHFPSVLSWMFVVCVNPFMCIK